VKFKTLSIRGLVVVTYCPVSGS